MSKQKQSTTLTIRLEQTVLGILKEEAQRQGLSVNVLVNRQLRKYVDWGRHAERYGMITIPKDGLRRLLKAIPDATLRELGASAGKDGPRDLILFIWGDVTLENAIKLLHIYDDHHRMGNLEQHEEDGKIRFVLHHEMGIKRSIYMEAYFTSMFETLFNYTPQIETTVRSVALTISSANIRSTHQQTPKG